MGLHAARLGASPPPSLCYVSLTARVAAVSQVLPRGGVASDLEGKRLYLSGRDLRNLLSLSLCCQTAVLDREVGTGVLPSVAHAFPSVPASFITCDSQYNEYSYLKNESLSSLSVFCFVLDIYYYLTYF